MKKADGGLILSLCRNLVDQRQLGKSYPLVHCLFYLRRPGRSPYEKFIALYFPMDWTPQGIIDKLQHGFSGLTTYLFQGFFYGGNSTYIRYA